MRITFFSAAYNLRIWHGIIEKSCQYFYQYKPPEIFFKYLTFNLDKMKIPFLLLQADAGFYADHGFPFYVDFKYSYDRYDGPNC